MPIAKFVYDVLIGNNNIRKTTDLLTKYEDLNDD